MSNYLVFLRTENGDLKSRRVIANEVSAHEGKLRFWHEYGCLICSIPFEELVSFHKIKPANTTKNTQGTECDLSGLVVDEITSFPIKSTETILNEIQEKQEEQGITLNNLRKEISRQLDWVARLCVYHEK